jgi:type II secretory pathway component PulF
MSVPGAIVVKIETLLMVLLGFVVGVLILAMYLPIFAMGDLFHS